MEQPEEYNLCNLKYYTADSILFFRHQSSLPVWAGYAGKPSLPPKISLEYNWHPKPGTPEDKLYNDFLPIRESV